MIKWLGFCNKLTALSFNCLKIWLADWAFFSTISSCSLFDLLFLRCLWLTIFLWILSLSWRFVWHISYKFDSSCRLRFWNAMILRTFLFQLICLRNNRFDRYFIKVLVGKRAYRILFFGLFVKCLRVVSWGNWSILILTVFNILIKVADFVKKLHLFVHVLAFHTELIQEIKVWW